MKRILLIMIVLGSLSESSFSYETHVHSYIVQQAYSLLICNKLIRLGIPSLPILVRQKYKKE